MYLMPVAFGPDSGHYLPSINGQPEKRITDYYHPGDVQLTQVTYETDPDVLEAMIPDCYTLNDPWVSVTVCEFTNLGWQFGRTYNLINVSAPVHFKGERDDIDGDFVMVMFENQCEPIIGGRDTMGYAKIFCNIPRTQRYGTVYTNYATNLDFRFMKLQIDTSKPCPDIENMRKYEGRSAGKMNFKYIPGVKEKDDPEYSNFKFADIAYPTILPNWEKPDDYPYEDELLTPQITFCDGSVTWYSPEWEDMPAMHRVAQGLASLECKRVIGAKHGIYSDPCHYTSCYRLR